MMPLVPRALGRIVTLREGEGATALLMFAFSFLAMTAYNVLKPATKSEFIGALGADDLPYAYLASGLVIAVLMQAYSQAASRLPARWLIPLTQAGEVVLLVVFWLLLLTGAAWVALALYVLGSILGILLISQFWTLANDVYDARQAKRIFGFIGGGASVGGLTGAGITSVIVGQVGVPQLLLVSAALLSVCIVIVVAILRQHAPEIRTAADGPSVGAGEAMRLLRSSRQLQLVALVIGAGAIGAQIVDQQLSMAAEWYFGPDATPAMATFFARVTFVLSALGLLIQVGLTSRIHRHLGVGIALLILPVGLGATAGLILISGAVWAAATARIVDGSLRYTVDKTTREVLFLPLSPSERHRAKPFVDVTVERMAKALVALLLLVLIKDWGLGLDWRQLSYASLLLMTLWIAVAILARREYLRSFRRSLGARSIAPSTIRIDVADASTIETLVEQLASPDDDAVLYAIELLETLDKRNLITPLLLHHHAPKVRARALIGLEAASPSTRERWAPQIESLLKDDDAEVRAAAVHALSLLGMEAAAVTMRRYLDDRDPRVAVTAAGVLAASGLSADARMAEALFQRLAEDLRPSAARARQEVASALARTDRPALRSLLVSLMLDPEVAVAREAIRSVRLGERCHPVFVPVLVALLGHRELKRDARNALLGCGPEVVAILAYLLRDREEQPWVRRHLPATLAGLPLQASMDALVPALDDPDGFLRFKALEAIERLHQQDPTLTFDRAQIERQITRETADYCNCLILKHNLLRESPAVSGALLVRALDDAMGRAVDRLYRLMGLLYPWKDIVAARHTLEHGTSTRQRAGAIEYLDNLIGNPLRRRIIPVIDDTPPDEKVRQAYGLLKTRPRDFDDSLAQLIHDEDAVVSAAAIHCAVGQRRDGLRSDVEFVLTHRPPADRHAVEAAVWALEQGLVPRANDRPTAAELPAVVMADSLRQIPLFSFVSVDELFRVASAGRQVSCGAGRSLYSEGRAVDRVRFLLEGRVRAFGDGRPAEELVAPLALGAEGALGGYPIDETIEATSRAICLELEPSAFLMMLGDHEPLARGVFRVLLAGVSEHLWDSLAAPSANDVASTGRPLRPIDQVYVLRAHPLFARATPDELLDLVSLTRQLFLTPGTTFGGAGERPALYHLLDGQIRLERDGSGPVLVNAGRTIGAVEVLTGVSEGWQATVVTPAHVLSVPGDDLFRLLGDHTDLLQSLLSGVLRTARQIRQRSPGTPRLLVG